MHAWGVGGFRQKGGGGMCEGVYVLPILCVSNMPTIVFPHPSPLNIFLNMNIKNCLIYVGLPPLGCCTRLLCWRPLADARFGTLFGTTN